MKNAGIIVIGDEILSGTVIDTNSNFLCKRFHALGIKVVKISTIPDDVNLIAQEVVIFSESYDIVITTGGVGPTHDDVTYESLAKAFHVDLAVDEDLKKFFRWYLKQGDGNGLKLVTIPRCSEVIYVNLKEPLDFGSNIFPIVKTFNVYSFPGVPSCLQKTFVGMQEQYFKTSEQFFNRTIFLNVHEINVVKVLNDVTDKYNKSVVLGSYPKANERDEYLNKITIESTSYENCLAAENELLSKIPPSWVMYLNSRLPDFEFIRRLLSGNGRLSEKIRESFEIIADCFSKYSVSDTFICFNGGKDCTVMFNLLYCYCLLNDINHPLTLVYFNDINAFPELDIFIELVKNSYNVELLKLPTPMKDSLRTYLGNKSGKSACFLGLRRSDPNGDTLNTMQETDQGWPVLMRVFPILYWSYVDIWNFLRIANIPYCSLYNQGYTSLGNKNNTSQNPALKYVTEDGVVHYKPAFLLNEEHAERNGR